MSSDHSEDSTSSEENGEEGIECPQEPPETRSILRAAQKGNLPRVKQLVESNPLLLNVQDSDGYTPLHRSCYNGHVEVVDILLPYEISIIGHQGTENFDIPTGKLTHTVVLNISLPTFFLIAPWQEEGHKSKICDYLRSDSRHAAPPTGNEIQILYLLSRGALFQKTFNGWEPLHSAAKWNQAKCVAKLLEHNADVNVQSKGGLTPLHVAAENGAAQETLQLLLMHPYIDATILNASNETAEEIARRSGRFGYLFKIAHPAINCL